MSFLAMAVSKYLSNCSLVDLFCDVQEKEEFPFKWHSTSWSRHSVTCREWHKGEGELAVFSAKGWDWRNISFLGDSGTQGIGEVAKR